MPVALPVKQQCFSDTASKPQGVNLGQPRNVPEAAAKGRNAQRAGADSDPREWTAGHRGRDGSRRNKL
jgi:hypothetical protein